MMRIYSSAIICIIISAWVQPSMALTLGFGNVDSSTITQEAWQALNHGEWDRVDELTDKCIQLYGEQAQRMQNDLTIMPNATIAATYWALNDVGTCYYIKARSMKERGRIEESKELANHIIENLSFSQCWDESGWFWSIADASRDLILMTRLQVDFGDYSSQTLTVKAWETLASKTYEESLTYAKKCIQLYGEQAEAMMKRLTGFAAADKALNYWALNDVATCYFIQGEVHVALEEWEKALESFQVCFEKYTYGQCWDPSGWFWKPSQVARGRYEMIKEKRLNPVSDSVQETMEPIPSENLPIP